MNKKITTLIAVSLVTFTLTACSTKKYSRGYILDEKVLETIRAEVDNKNSVRTMMGSPTHEATFDGEHWYYISKQSEQYAFLKEEVKQMDIIAIAFDKDDYVTSIKRYDVNDLRNIEPSGDKTRTHGNDLTFLQELFGNIGTIGTAGRSTVQPGY